MPRGRRKDARTRRLFAPRHRGLRRTVSAGLARAGTGLRPPRRRNRQRDAGLGDRGISSRRTQRCPARDELTYLDERREAAMSLLARKANRDWDTLPNGARVHATALVGFEPMRGRAFARPTDAPLPPVSLAPGVVIGP